MPVTKACVCSTRVLRASPILKLQKNARKEKKKKAKKANRGGGGGAARRK